MSEPYWFSIQDAGAVRVGRFSSLASTLSLRRTASPPTMKAHLTRRRPPKSGLVSENGARLHARVSETIGDLALLDVLGFAAHGIIPPNIHEDLVEKDSLWEVPYRPSLQHPTLAGIVGNPALSFRCVDGTLVSALQLTVSEGVGDHSGYSGAPVATKGTDATAPAILGILIEQFPDQADPGRSANVLFAARLMHIWEFAAFEFDRRLLGGARASAKRTEQVLDTAELMLKRVKSWSENRYINDYEQRAWNARVQDYVFAEESAGRSK